MTVIAKGKAVNRQVVAGTSRFAVRAPSHLKLLYSDLVVEILSPSTASRDQVVKRKLHARYGVREYWIVDPAAGSVEVFVECQTGLGMGRVFSAGSLLTSPLLPGLSLSVDDVFAE